MLISMVFVLGLQISFETGKLYQANMLQKIHIEQQQELYPSYSAAFKPSLNQQEISINTKMVKSFQEKLQAFIGMITL